MFLEPENKLLSGSYNGTIKIWNLEAYQEEYSLESGLTEVYCGCRIPGTSRVAIGSSYPYYIKILDTNTR